MRCAASPRRAASAAVSTRSPGSGRQPSVVSAAAIQAEARRVHRGHRGVVGRQPVLLGERGQARAKGFRQRAGGRKGRARGKRCPGDGVERALRDAARRAQGDARELRDDALAVAHHEIGAERAARDGALGRHLCCDLQLRPRRSVKGDPIEAEGQVGRALGHLGGQGGGDHLRSGPLARVGR